MRPPPNWSSERRRIRDEVSLKKSLLAETIFLSVSCRGIPHGTHGTLEFIWNLEILWFLVKTHSDDNPRLPGRGLFLSEITRPSIFGTCFCDFHDFRTWKRRGKWFGEGSAKFQPVMFDMDPFGDKKVFRGILPQMDGQSWPPRRNDFLIRLHKIYFLSVLTHYMSQCLLYMNWCILYTI